MILIIPLERGLISALQQQLIYKIQIQNDVPIRLQHQTPYRHRGPHHDADVSRATGAQEITRQSKS